MDEVSMGETSESGMCQAAHPLFFEGIKNRISENNRGYGEMKPVFETEGTCLFIRLPKELDHPASDQIRRESDRIMGKIYIRSICFDFEDTIFMDSSGIGLIMGRYRALGMRSGCMMACHVNGYIEKLLRLSGVRRFLEVEKQDHLTEETKRRGV